MRQSQWLYCGPAAAVVLACGIAMLPFLVPGYNQIRQTVSEIGEQGSPAQIPFSAVLITVAFLILIFAIAVYRLSAVRGYGVLGASFVGFMAIPSAGLALFPFPHPLHNLFGTSELIAYQAPLVFAIQLRKDPEAATMVTFSWICFVVLWTSIAINFVVFFRNSDLWHEVRPAYGLIQRSLFAVFAVWLFGAGVLLRRIAEEASRMANFQTRTPYL